MTEQPARAAGMTPFVSVPSKPRGLWRRFTWWYGRVLGWLLVVSVAILIVPVTMQIFSRFTQIIPHYIWTEEMARFLFIWMIMIGAMLGVREGTHFEVDLWPYAGPRLRAAMDLFAAFAILAFSLVFVWSGIEFTQFAWNRISELAELPLWVIHVAWPITGLTWLAFLGERIWDSARVAIAGGG